ncbi:MAG: transglycosylase domain-containing protein [Deltaproteobacteria bacterium]|nr:transglycosylase domain-containing protein [Deltaproteobacteria bacterium]
MTIRSGKTIRSFFKSAMVYFMILTFIVVAIISSIVIWTFEIKLRRWPTMIFSAPTNISVGSDVDNLQFYKRLTRLGYSQSQSGAPSVGEWQQSGNELKIFLRYCPFVEDRLVEGPVTISLDDSTIKSIRLMRSLQDIKYFQLEPELIGIIPAKGRPPEMCVPIRLDQVPSLLTDAILLTEDNRFYSHSGIDIISIYRALISNLQAGRYVQGASTITQQLIRMTLLSPEKTLWRKSLEILLSLGADAIFSKETILEAYLNRVYLGQFGSLPVLGVSEAARNFFGKSADQLDVSECALIAATIRAPNIINPFKHPERTRSRRNMILGLLFRHGKISRETYDESISKPVRMFKPGAPPPKAGSFVDIVKEQILTRKNSIDTAKNYIATSLDPLLQAELEVNFRKLGDMAQQTYAIVVNPKWGSILGYMAPTSEKWDGAGGNIELFAPMVLVPGFTPQRISDPLFTLASQITLSQRDNRRFAFQEAFKTDRKELIRRIIEVTGTDKVIEALGEFRVNAEISRDSEILTGPLTPFQVAQSYCLLANLGTAGTINCRRLQISDNQTEIPDQLRVSVPPAVLFIINSVIRDLHSVKDSNDSPKKLLLSPSFLLSSDSRGIWSIAYHRSAVVLLRIPSSNLSSTFLRKLTLRILPSPTLDQGPDSAIPPGLVFRKLCEESGLRATSTCPHVTLLPFITGTQPDEWCTLRHETDTKPGSSEKKGFLPK